MAVHEAQGRNAVIDGTQLVLYGAQLCQVFIQGGTADFRKQLQRIAEALAQQPELMQCFGSAAGDGSCVPCGKPFLGHHRQRAAGVLGRCLPEAPPVRRG